MKDRYKVWVQIERVGDQTPDGENVSEEADVAEFATLEEAEKFVGRVESLVDHA